MTAERRPILCPRYPTASFRGCQRHSERDASGPNEINIVLTLRLGGGRLDVMSVSYTALTRENAGLARRCNQILLREYGENHQHFQRLFNVPEEKWEYLSLFAFNFVSSFLKMH